MKLFQYAILFHPLEKDRTDTGAQSKVISEVKTILAKDGNAATLLAARSIPEEYVDKLDRVEVVIRPF